MFVVFFAILQQDCEEQRQPSMLTYHVRAVMFIVGTLFIYESVNTVRSQNLILLRIISKDDPRLRLKIDKCIWFCVYPRFYVLPPVTVALWGTSAAIEVARFCLFLSVFVCFCVKCDAFWHRLNLEIARARMI